MGSRPWGRATAAAFSTLTQKECAEVAKPEWWNDEGLKALSARVVRAAQDDVDNAGGGIMRAVALSGHYSAREVGPRSVVELKEAATHNERAAALHPAQAMKAQLVSWADRCSRLAEANVAMNCGLFRYATLALM